MKRVIVVELLLIFIFAIGLMWSILSIQSCINAYENITFVPNQAEFFRDYFNNQLVKTIFTFLATIADLVAIILIAIKDFPVFKPLVDKYSAWTTARKAAKHAKSEKAANEKKQQRIADLEKALNELKKDD